MDPEKAEFKRLIDLMEWSQSEAARRLRKTPSAINHLVNPDHPNTPTQTTLQLLKLIIASERPDLFEEAFASEEKPARPKPDPTRPPESKGARADRDVAGRRRRSRRRFIRWSEPCSTAAGPGTARGKNRGSETGGNGAHLKSRKKEGQRR